LKLRRWEEVRGVLMGFFYVERVHGRPFRDIWGKVGSKVEEGEPVDVGTP
jgi:hypothetical protein